MKFSWGTGIALFYILFMAAILFAVIKSTTYDNSLVFEDYYQKDLEYQKHYDRVKNANALTKDLEIDFDKVNQTVRFVYPPQLKAFSGEIQFYNPAFSQKDFKLKVQPNADLIQEVDVAKLQRGRWQIKTNWASEGKTFYKEKSIFLE